jgi:hypothetical protein
MTAFMVAVAWCVGALLLALVIGDVITRRDRREHRAPVIDLAAARRLRALGRAVERHPSGGGRP